MKRFLGLVLVGAMVFPTVASAQFGFKVKNPVKVIEKTVKEPTKVAETKVPDWQVRNSMNTNLEQLNTHCPMNVHPSDINRCKSVSTNMRKQVDAVELQNRILPEYKQVVELLEAVEKQIPVWEDKEKADADAKKLADQASDDFKQKVRAQGIIGTIWSMKQDPNKRLDMSAEILLKEVERAKAMEAEFLEPCKAGSYADVKTFNKETDWDHPTNVCDVAQNWRGYYKTYVEHVIDHLRTRTAKSIDFYLKELEEDGRLYEENIIDMTKAGDTVANYVSTYAALCKEFEIPLAADYFANVIDAAKPYAKTLKKAGEVQRWDDKATFSDKDISAALKKAVGDEKLSVKKIGLTHSDYSVTKNEFGIPLYKIRSGYVMAKASGESFCRIYYLTVRADYVGGSEAYTKPFLNFERKSEGFIVSKCK